MPNKMMKPKIKPFALKDLAPAKYNPRKISKEAMAGLTASLQRFGNLEPIIVNVRNGKNTIVGGHQKFAILLRDNGPDHRCTCVAVDLSTNDEKLLNLTLNNPAIQGEFISALDSYIKEFAAGWKDKQVLLDLKIDKLREQIPTQSRGCTYIEEPLQVFKRTHVLLSFPPELLPQIHGHLKAILRLTGVEYEQGSN